jgi:hypothetical protein
MVEDLGIVAPGVLEGIGKNRHGAMGSESRGAINAE